MTRMRVLVVTATCLASAHAAIASAASPLEFAPAQVSIAAPPYPVPQLATAVSVDEGSGPETVESFAVIVHAADALNPSAALPITAVAGTAPDGKSFEVELRWTPAGQESFPDELLFDLRIALAPAGGRTPEQTGLDTGEITRGLLVTLAAELADLQGQLASVYASHFVEVAAGPSLDAAWLDPDVSTLAFEPPLVRVGFRLARNGPATPAPGEPILILTATGTTAGSTPGVSTLPRWGMLVLALALFAAARLRARD